MGKKYVVQRRNVCGGIVLHETKYEVENVNNKESMIFLSRVGPTLFSVGHNNLANDLLCTTRPYPIDGKSELIGCQFNIHNYVELNELLKYLKYGEDLTQKDLWTFYNKVLMNPKWLEKHRKLFGWEIEEGTGEWVHHQDLEILPLSIYTSLKEIIPPTKQMAREERRPQEIEPRYDLIKKRR